MSVKEARRLLGKDAKSMTDKDIEYVIDTLGLLTKDSLEQTRHKMLIRKDSMALADFLYDVYKERKDGDK